MALQKVLMMEMSLVQLTEMDSEPQTAILRETCLVCLSAEQMATQMVLMMESN